MLALVLAVASSVALSAVSVGLVRRVARAPSPHGAELASRLAQATKADRAARARATSREGSWERRLAEAALCVDLVERRDRLSEVVDELAIELGKSAQWGATLLRLQLLVGGFATILSLLGEVVVAAQVGVCVVAGGVVIATNKRRGEALERSQRALADRLVMLIDPDHRAGAERGPRGRP